MLTIIIPSKTERFLDNTIQDVLDNATGEIKVIPVIDGYEPDKRINDPRVSYLKLPATDYMKKRHGINQAVAETDSKYVMALDAHCLVAKGFDEQLIKDHQDNWVQIPRRHRLDAENWCLQDQVDDRPPIDYEYIMWPNKTRGDGLHGFKWDARTKERWDIPIDDTLTFQGSCWFMTKDWYNKIGIMEVEGFTGWGQEAEEIGFKTRLHGGRVITNKNTYYAHLHKGPIYGRMYYMPRQQTRECNAYSYDYWVNKHKDLFIKTIEQFWPLPNWPENWREQLWTP